MFEYIADLFLSPLKFIAKLFTPSKAHDPYSAESLNLSYKNINKKWMEANKVELAKYKNLKELNISSNNCGPEVAMEILECIPSSMEKLVLKENKLFGQQSDILKIILGKFPNLKELDLSYSYRDNYDAFEQMLSQLPKDLKHTKLEKLDLSNGYFDNIKLLAKFLELVPNLKVLDLNWNWMGHWYDKDKDSLKDLQPLHQELQLLHQNLPKNLKDLNLGGNSLEPKGLGILLSAESPL